MASFLSGRRIPVSFRLTALAVAALAASFALGAVLDAVHAGKYTYPEAKTVDASDDYHGTVVADPYRWLEDPDAEDTLDWVTAENALTREYVDSYAGRDKIADWLTKLWNYPRYTLPYKYGDRYFFRKNDGLQNQSVVYMQRSLDGEATVVIDPNKLSEDGTIALRNARYSEDGTLLAYGLSSSGSDWQEIRVREVDTGKDFDEVLEWCKFSSIAWKHDNSGFYYNRFPAEGEVPEEDRNNYSRVYWHELGTPQSEDPLVYEDRANKEYGFGPTITDDGRYVILLAYHGTDDRNGVFYREVKHSDEDFVTLLDLHEARYSFVDNIGSTWYFNTTLDAPRGRIIAIDVEKPDRKNWKVIIPQSDDVIDFVTMVDNKFVVGYMRDAHNQLKLFDKKGKYIKEIELPTIGSVWGLSGKREDEEMFFGFTSYVYPTTAFRYDFDEDELSVFRASEIDFDASKYTTEQFFFKSKDGTRVPMFVTYKKGLKKDGRNPCWLYGYGGFNISLTPYFSASRLLWLEMGGVYVVANIRGGEEYGEEWHQGGILGNKQNVFDDFIAAAEYLIAEGWTSTPKLLISGGSNGGLLVAACLTQRPELYGAVVCRVPVVDMLRYHKFTVGRYWVSDYGNAEADPGHFEFLYEYSPLHNIESGATHPPTLITSADTDDRVVPAHAKKFAAALQAADSGNNPILLRVEMKAGHGGGKPMSKIIEEYADIYSFVFKTLGISTESL
jgi:prolyl oligopeptidase